jgi:hypothetical protein
MTQGDRPQAVDTTDVGDYWTGIEDEIVSCLRDHGPMPPDELGDYLRISRGAAVSLIAMLARDGKVRIGLVELASEPARVEVLRKDVAMKRKAKPSSIAAERCALPGSPDLPPPRPSLKLSSTGLW